MRVAICFFSVILLNRALFCAEERKPANAESTEKPFQFTGRVVDESDRPVAGAEVESLGDMDRATTRAGDEGRFVLIVPRKPHVLFLRAEESRAGQALAIYLLDERSRHTLRPFLPQIEPGLPDDVKLVVRPPRKIEAVVVDGQKRPVPDAKVFVQATWYQKVSEATTDANGKATLRVPLDSPLSAIVAMKGGIGMDYFLYRNPATEKSDRYRLALDHDNPLTLILNGIRRITVKVADEAGAPLQAVKVSPFSLEKPHKGIDGNIVKNPFNGGAMYARLPDFTVASNSEGSAIFDFIPPDCMGGVSFNGIAPDYDGYQNVFVQAGGDDAEATLYLLRVLEVSGRVTFADGRPAARCAVSVTQEALDDGRNTGRLGQPGFATSADDEGRVRLRVYPNHFLLLAAYTKEFAAPLQTCLVGNQPPDQPLKIILHKATRVHGRLTAGPDDRPIFNPQDTFQFIIAMRAEDAYQEVRNRGMVLKSDTRRGGAAAVNDIRLLNSRVLSTNDVGEFEVFLGPGKYQIHYGQNPPTHVELNGEAEHEVNVHVDRPTHEAFSGQIVMQGQPQRPVADAVVTGIALQHRDDPGGMHVVTNERGSFRVTRRAVPMMLYARTPDRTVAGIVRVGADDRSVIIAIGPTASAHGRLIDATSGEPLADMKVLFGIAWDGPNTGQECGGSVTTNDGGEFVATGLVSGWNYQFWAGTGSRHRIASMTPDDPEEIDLGDLKLESSPE